MSMLEPLPPFGEQDTLDLDQVIEVRVPFLPIDAEPPTWGLVPFTGRKTLCIKCQIGKGSDDSPVAAEYHAGVTSTTVLPCYNMIRFDMERYNQIGFPEHLDRRCPVCGYRWVEALAEPGKDQED